MGDAANQQSAYQAHSQPNQPPPPQMQTAPQPQYVQAQVYNIPATSIPSYPAVQSVVQNEGWWRRNQKNKPQSNSAGSAALIFISGGMSMAWKLGFSLSPMGSKADHIICSWFIGGIIGAIVGAFACNNISKKALVGFASILVAICGVLQVSDPNSYDAILASRYLNGIAVGLVFPLTFVLIGEEVVKPLRGMNAVSVDTMSFGCGIFIQILYTSIWSYELEAKFRTMQLSGVLNIIFGVVALLIGFFCIIESPLYYLVRGDEQMAIDSLRRLQQPFTITYETYELLEEHKLYLAESNERTLPENAVYGIPALLKLCFYRSFMALTISYYVNLTFTYSCFITTQFRVYPFILYALARWLGPILVVFSLDVKGRKLSMIFGFLVCTILAFSVGGIFDVIDRDYINTIKYILIFFQLFASMSMASSSAYLSEAFPLPVKPYYVAIVFITEMLVHIIIICCRDVQLYRYFFALGSLSLVFLGVAIFIMPETKCFSLRACLPKFRQLNNFHK